MQLHINPGLLDSVDAKVSYRSMDTTGDPTGRSASGTYR
jgi:hypothetical protein